MDFDDFLNEMRQSGGKLPEPLRQKQQAELKELADKGGLTDWMIEKTTLGACFLAMARLAEAIDQSSPEPYHGESNAETFVQHIAVKHPAELMAMLSACYKDSKRQLDSYIQMVMKER